MANAQISDQIMEEAKGILNKSRGLSQRVAIFCNRLVGENDAIAVEVKSLQQACKAAEAAARAHPEPQLASDVLAELKAARDVLHGLGPGGDLRKFCKPRPPLLLRLLLGDKVNLIAYRTDQAMGMKEEYHRFRDRAVWIMLVVPAFLALGMRRAESVKGGSGITDHTFTPGLMTFVQLYFLWLSYFYLALAMRENVLLVNGSNIKGWWIQHHYWSAGASLLLLGLPVYSQAVYMFCQYFLMWSCFQALVMMLQNRYQRRRMYTRIAVGKSRAMDVVSGESSGTSGQLLVLYPMLFLLQVSQFAIGAGVAYKTWPAVLAKEGWLEVEAPGSDLRGMRGVCVVGLVFCFMAVRNFQATLSTVLEKRTYAKKMKRSKSRGGLSVGGSKEAAAEQPAGAATSGTPAASQPHKH